MGLRHGGEIRKITFGVNPLKEGVVFVVGKPAPGMRTHVITGIIEDTQNHLIYGTVRYIVLAKRVEESDDKEKVLRAFERIPVMIEYDVNKISTTIS